MATRSQSFTFAAVSTRRVIESPWPTVDALCRWPHAEPRDRLRVVRGVPGRFEQYDPRSPVSEPNAARSPNKVEKSSALSLAWASCRASNDVAPSIVRQGSLTRPTVPPPYGPVEL